MNTDTLRLPMIVLLIALLLIPTETAIQAETLRVVYAETTEDLLETIIYELEYTEATINLLLETPGEIHRMQFDRDFNTRTWLVMDESGHVHSSVTEQDGQVYLQEEGRQELITESLRLPWYQSLYCLSPRVVEGQSGFKFYMASADFGEELMKASGIQFTKFIAKREERETIDIDGERVPTVKYKITFDDIRALFWRSYAWFRESDGFLVGYESTRGGPGTPPTVGVLVSANPRGGGKAVFE
jgi:hypothetical protein